LQNLAKSYHKVVTRIRRRRGALSEPGGGLVDTPEGSP